MPKTISDTSGNWIRTVMSAFHWQDTTSYMCSRTVVNLYATYVSRTAIDNNLQSTISATSDYHSSMSIAAPKW